MTNFKIEFNGNLYDGVFAHYMGQFDIPDIEVYSDLSQEINDEVAWFAYELPESVEGKVILVEETDNSEKKYHISIKV